MKLYLSCFLFILAAFLALAKADDECGPNTRISCRPDYCGQECDAATMLAARIRCPHACIQGGCRCIQGYSYDRASKTCVPSDQCP